MEVSTTPIYFLFVSSAFVNGASKLDDWLLTRHGPRGYADAPRLITVWEAWLDFQGLTRGGPVFHSEEAIAQERARRHELVGAHDLAPFTTFATQVGGLTTRQAEAMFWKDWFWLVREGNVTYPDERGPAQAHAGVSLQHC